VVTPRCAPKVYETLGGPDLHGAIHCGLQMASFVTSVQDALLTKDDNLETQREREAGAKDGNAAMENAW
jgi:hypothetical protein